MTRYPADAMSGGQTVAVVLVFVIAFGLTFGILGVVAPKAPRGTIGLIALIIGLIGVVWAASSF